MIDNYITGSSGFIGSRLKEKLSAEETRIVGHEYIAGFYAEPCRRFFFLSAYGNMSHQSDVGKMIKANIADVSYVVNQCKTESFVYLSSSSVNLPVLTPYARTKRAAEEMLQATDLPYCIIRPFSVTGVSEQKQHLIPKLIHSCMTGEQMDLVLEPTHDYVDVDDVTNGILALADRKAKGVFEFGSGICYSNGEVLNLVEEITGKKANVTIVKTLRDYDDPNWVCKDFTARHWGWKPVKTLSDSIKEMVEAYGQ